jgi:hypothetical protein
MKHIRDSTAGRYHQLRNATNDQNKTASIHKRDSPDLILPAAQIKAGSVPRPFSGELNPRLFFDLA